MMFWVETLCGRTLTKLKVSIWRLLGYIHVSQSAFSLASCPKCNHDSAYFYQLQIRSADEPMTTCMHSLLSLL